MKSTLPRLDVVVPLALAALACVGCQGPGASGPHEVVEPAPVGPRLEDPDSLAIQAAMRKRLPNFRGCYEAWMREHGAASGRAMLRFEIAADGRATTIEVDTDLDGPIFARCLEWTLTTIHFELVRERKTFVAYPLRFTPERSATPPK